MHVICKSLLLMATFALTACDQEPLPDSSTPGRPVDSGACSFYDGSRLRPGENRCWKGDLYSCSGGSLVNIGKSHPSCR